MRPRPFEERPPPCPPSRRKNRQGRANDNGRGKRRGDGAPVAYCLHDLRRAPREIEPQRPIGAKGGKPCHRKQPPEPSAGSENGGGPVHSKIERHRKRADDDPQRGEGNHEQRALPRALPRHCHLPPPLARAAHGKRTVAATAATSQRRSGSLYTMAPSGRAWQMRVRSNSRARRMVSSVGTALVASSGTPA